MPAIPLSGASAPPADWRAGDVEETPGPSVEPLRLYGLEFSLASASIDQLEEVARGIGRNSLAEQFSAAADTEEVALLSTCHRVELIFIVRTSSALDRWRDVFPGNRARWVVREGPEVVDHLFRVAAGRESLAEGETEIRDQVRGASHRVVSRCPRPVLRSLLEEAASAADHPNPSLRARSISQIASDRVAALVPSEGANVLVVGSGTIGRQVVERLAPRFRVTVVFHRQPPTETFLSATRARAVPFDRLREELARADAVVTAAKVGDHELRARDFPSGRPVVVVDLGMPRNVDPDTRQVPNVRLVDLEELYERSRTEWPPTSIDATVTRQARRSYVRLERRMLEPWIDTWRRAAEEVRSAELATAYRFLGELTPAQTAAVDRLTQRLVSRLLLAPTERLRALPTGPAGEAQRRLAVALLDPRPAGT